MNAFRTALAVLLSTVVVSHVDAADRKTIKIATEGAFPPWNAVDADGKAIGFDIDVGRELCRHAKLTCEFVTQDWDGIIPALNVGKYHAIMAGMSITEKLKQVIAFSRPYALTSNYFVIRKELDVPVMDADSKIDLSRNDDETKQILASLISNLKGHSIGVQRSTNAEAFIREYFGDSVEIRSYDNQGNLNLDLASGRIDGGLADYSVWKTFLASGQGATGAFYGPRISGGVFGPGVGIGLRKQDVDLVAIFNDAIDSVSADGTLAELSLKWFGADLVSR